MTDSSDDKKKRDALLAARERLRVSQERTTGEQEQALISKQIEKYRASLGKEAPPPGNMSKKEYAIHLQRLYSKKVAEKQKAFTHNLEKLKNQHHARPTMTTMMTREEALRKAQALRDQQDKKTKAIADEIAAKARKEAPPGAPIRPRPSWERPPISKGLLSKEDRESIIPSISAKERELKAMAEAKKREYAEESRNNLKKMSSDELRKVYSAKAPEHDGPPQEGTYRPKKPSSAPIKPELRRPTTTATPKSVAVKRTSLPTPTRTKPVPLKSRMAESRSKTANASNTALTSATVAYDAEQIDYPTFSREYYRELSGRKVTNANIFGHVVLQALKHCRYEAYKSDPDLLVPKLDNIIESLEGTKEKFHNILQHVLVVAWDKDGTTYHTQPIFRDVSARRKSLEEEKRQALLSAQQKEAAARKAREDAQAREEATRREAQQAAQAAESKKRDDYNAKLLSEQRLISDSQEALRQNFMETDSFIASISASPQPGELVKQANIDLDLNDLCQTIRERVQALRTSYSTIAKDFAKVGATELTSKAGKDIQATATQAAKDMTRAKEAANAYKMTWQAWESQKAEEEAEAAKHSEAAALKAKEEKDRRDREEAERQKQLKEQRDAAQKAEAEKERKRVQDALAKKAAAEKAAAEEARRKKAIADEAQRKRDQDARAKKAAAEKAAALALAAQQEANRKAQLKREQQAAKDKAFAKNLASSTSNTSSTSTAKSASKALGVDTKKTLQALASSKNMQVRKQYFNTTAAKKESASQAANRAVWNPR